MQKKKEPEPRADCCELMLEVNTALALPFLYEIRISRGHYAPLCRPPTTNGREDQLWQGRYRSGNAFGTFGFSAFIMTISYSFKWYRSMFKVLGQGWGVSCLVIAARQFVVEILLSERVWADKARHICRRAFQCSGTSDPAKKKTAFCCWESESNGPALLLSSVKSWRRSKVDEWTLTSECLHIQSTYSS